VRLLATSTFASLIRLVPLDGSGESNGSDDNVEQSASLLPLDMSRRRDEERRFLDQLTNPAK
jgi:hypothetical protein